MVQIRQKTTPVPSEAANVVYQLFVIRAEEKSVYLGHYTSLDTLELILGSMNLKFGCMTNTNDPFENRNVFFGYRKLLNPGQLTTLSDYFYKNENVKSKFYVLCFSEQNNTDAIVNKPRMWSQYTHKHRGCCILFKKEGFDIEVSKLRHKEQVSGNVTYDLDEKREAVEELSFELSNMVSSRTRIDEIRNFIWTNRMTYLFSKMKDWSEESEYRYCVYSSKVGEEILVDIRGSIERIVLGDNVSVFMLKSLASYCTENGISLTQVYWRNGFPIERKVDDRLFDFHQRIAQTRRPDG